MSRDEIGQYKQMNASAHATLGSAAMAPDRKGGTVSDAIEQLYIEIGRMREARNILISKLNQVMQPPVPTAGENPKQGNQGSSALSSVIYEAAISIRLIRQEIEDANERIDL